MLLSLLLWGFVIGLPISILLPVVVKSACGDVSLDTTLGWLRWAGLPWLTALGIYSWGGVEGNPWIVGLAAMVILLVLPFAIVAITMAIGTGLRAAFLRDAALARPIAFVLAAVLGMVAVYAVGLPGVRPFTNTAVRAHFQSHRLEFETLRMMMTVDGLASVDTAWGTLGLPLWSFQSPVALPDGRPTHQPVALPLERRLLYAALLQRVNGGRDLYHRNGTFTVAYWELSFGAWDSGSWQNFVYREVDPGGDHSLARRCSYTALGDGWYVESC